MKSSNYPKKNTILESRSEKLERAKNYPFSPPSQSYLFVQGHALKFVDINIDSFGESTIKVGGKIQRIQDYLISKEEIRFEYALSNRTPVLAIGSNSSLVQLRRKYSDELTHTMIPVIKASLHDFDSVYSAHIGFYGSIPATLQYSPNTKVDTFITYLTDSQLERMHQTERVGKGGYYFGKLRDIRLSVANVASLHEIYVYISQHKCLFLNGSHISLSSIRATRRKFPAKSELEVLGSVYNVFGVKEDLDTFILQNINSTHVRQKRNAQLEKTAKDFDYNKIDRVKG